MIAGYKGQRLTRTTLDLCPYCHSMTRTFMDDDGNRYCGHCKKKIIKENNNGRERK